MERVGIRELRLNASAVIRRVAAGESVEVTDRGRPVAQIVPIGRGGVIDRLIGEGRVIPGGGRLLDHEPMPRRPGERLLSDVLAEMREEDER